MIEYNELYNEVKNVLSAKRFKHTEGVIKRAVEYGKIYNENLEDIKYAALIHDVAKELSNEESCRILNKYNVEIDYVEKNNFNLIHAKVGSILAKYKYNLNDKVVSAVKYHTTARENMTMLEKIIYLADATEENRQFKEIENELSLDELVTLIENDIDEGLYYTLKWNLESVLKRNLLIHLDTVKAYNFYKKL